MPDEPIKSDAQLLADAQFLLGLVERYRPGTLEEAKQWFGEHLKQVYAKAQTDSAQSGPRGHT